MNPSRIALSRIRPTLFITQCRIPPPTAASTSFFRSFSRSSDPTSSKTAPSKAENFIRQVGYPPAIAKGVVQALQEAGMTNDALLLSTVKSLAGRWEVGEDEGLEALCASVQQELASKEGKATVTFYVVPPNAWESSEQEDDSCNDSSTTTTQILDWDKVQKSAFPVQALEGMSLTDVAKFGTGEGAKMLGEYLECACAGIMACSTCHVVVADNEHNDGNNKTGKKYFDLVGPPSEDEQDMIDLAYNPKDHSRLGCQVVLTKEMDGLTILIPKSANNLMDFIPFE